LLENRRPVMTDWATFIYGDAASNVVPLRREMSE
jgi:hypothetical protein